MANVLAAHRSSVVVAGALIFGAGALLGHVLTETGPWGRPDGALKPRLFASRHLTLCPPPA